MKRNFYLGLLAFCILLVTGSAKAATVTTDPHDTTVCSGTRTAFTVAASGSSVTYSWQMSTDGSTWTNVVDDTVTYLGSSNDTLQVAANRTMTGYMYRAIAHDTTYDTSAAATLTVLAIPPGTIAGPSVLCHGTTITLTDTVAGGVWSSTTPAVATVGSSTGIVTGVAFGYDTIKYTVSNTCGSGTASLVIRVDSTVTALPIGGPTATCVGHSITLTNANVLGTWVWSATNSTATITHAGVLTGVSHGLDTIIYSFTNTCNSVISGLAITVDTVLYPGVISGPTHVCVGSGISLTETVSGGLWLSSSSAIAVVDGTGNVTGISAGTAVITYLLTNACGASIASHTVTVERMASAITGGDSVGIGLTLTLSDSATGGTWSINGADTNIAVISTAGVVTGRDTGIATVTYTVTNACGTSSAMLTIYVGPGATVAITGADSVCVGATTALFASLAGGTWSSSNNSIATVSVGGNVTGVAYGLDTIYYTVSNGFGTVTASKTIFVNQPPVVNVTGPFSVATGGNYFISGTPYGGTWSNSNNSVGVIIAVIDSVGLHLVSQASFIMLTEGVDTVSYSVHNTCGTTVGHWVAALHPASVSTVADNNASLEVYPNPNSGSFVVNMTSASVVRAKVTITNAVGAVVKELNIATNQPYSIQLDEPSGIYFLSATTASGKYDAKLSITK